MTRDGRDDSGPKTFGTKAGGCVVVLCRSMAGRSVKKNKTALLQKSTSDQLSHHCGRVVMTKNVLFA